MSRNSEFSDVENFDLLNEKTYFNSNIELNGMFTFRDNKFKTIRD